jgi:hypothetical protein
MQQCQIAYKDSRLQARQPPDMDGDAKDSQLKLEGHFSKSLLSTTLHCFFFGNLKTPG